MNDSQLDTKILLTARRLTDLQRQLLQCLKDKGPGFLLELAVRVLKFPEDVQEPLRQLQSIGLVGTQSVSGGQFGSEIYTLTSYGDRVLLLLNDPMFQQETQAAASPPAPSDPRWQEADLLNKLGDLAKEKGELEKAIEYYQKALELTRQLSAGGGLP
ncbi:MAG TPA: tetratricopeptide repeat protein [Blastocatellia bacterium]|nr:tetratricopeptide repeat protein [Blastocatellia bacterium]